MTLKGINRIYFSILIGLVLIGIGGIYWMFWIAESLWVRVGIFFGVGGFIMFIFMAATFACAGYANAVDMESRREEAE